MILEKPFQIIQLYKCFGSLSVVLTFIGPREWGASPGSAVQWTVYSVEYNL